MIIFRGSPAKTEGDLLSSRDYEDAPENLSQAPPLQPRDSLPGVSSIALQAVLVSQIPAAHI